jgi:hypothetical protein
MDLPAIGLDSRNTRCHVYQEAITAQYVVALGEYGPAEHRDQIGLGVEYCSLPGHNLVFLRHYYIAACFALL